MQWHFRGWVECCARVEFRGVISRMRRSGKWHCLEDIATKYGLGAEVEIYRWFLAAMRAGKFDELGVLFLNADPRGRRDQRVTRAMVEDKIELFGAEIDARKRGLSQVVIHFLRHCWVPDALYRRFRDDLNRPNETQRAPNHCPLTTGADFDNRLMLSDKEPHGAKSAAAWRAMKALWPNGVPRSRSNQEIANEVNKWLKQPENGRDPAGVSAKTIERVRTSASAFRKGR